MKHIFILLTSLFCLNSFADSNNSVIGATIKIETPFRASPSRPFPVNKDDWTDPSACEFYSTTSFKVDENMVFSVVDQRQEQVTEKAFGMSLSGTKAVYVLENANKDKLQLKCWDCSEEQKSKSYEEAASKPHVCKEMTPKNLKLFLAEAQNIDLKFFQESVSGKATSRSTAGASNR